MHTDHMPPTSPQELISQMKENYQKFLDACHSLTQEQALQPGVCGEWSAKAVVDHLTGWQVESLPILKMLLETDKQDFDLDIDAFNAVSVEKREALSWQESLTALELSCKSFYEGIDKISVSRYRLNAGLRSWLRAMIHEYQFHLQHIQNTKQASL